MPGQPYWKKIPACLCFLLLLQGLLPVFSPGLSGAARAAELHEIRVCRPPADMRTAKKAKGPHAQVREYTVLHLFNPFLEDNLLAEPDTRPSLSITKAYPRLDGSTSFLPVYAAAFKALYVPPPKSAGPEALLAYKTSIKCSSSRGFASFLRGESDIFFGFEPANELQRQAGELGVRLRLIPLGKEAFVFCVNETSPVDNLSLEQIRGIYSGAITNWKETGGPDKKIVPLQRIENSGSQTAMERYVMKDTPFPRSSQLPSMLGILEQIALYGNNEKMAKIGYSFRWYATDMSGIKGIKLLDLNGVKPDAESIRSERYPLIIPFYAIVREGKLSSETQALLDWFSGPEGQALVEKAGYVQVKASKP